MNRVERYWMAGYTVAGAPDTIVNRYCRSKKEAQQAAVAALVAPLRHLRALGIDGQVTAWVEEWTVERIEKHKERVPVGYRDTHRLGQVIDLTHTGEGNKEEA